MSSYNLRLVEYPTGLQLRVYSKPIHHSQKDSIDDPFKSSNVRTFNNTRSKQVSINRTVNTIYELARANIWSYFVTFTINPKLIDNSISNYDSFSKVIRKYLENLKAKYAPDLKYLIVPELHKDRVKIHFHALLANVGSIKFVDSGKVAVGKHTYSFENCPWGRKIFNMPLWKWGWSTATVVEDTNKVSGYMCKYITKDLLSLSKGKRRFWSSHNLERANVRFINADYGFIQSVISQNDNAVLFSKEEIIPDANLSVMYFEFDKSVTVDMITSDSDYNKLVYTDEQIYKINLSRSIANDYKNGFTCFPCCSVFDDSLKGV